MKHSEALLDAHIELSQTLRETHYGHTVVEYTAPPSTVEFAKAVGNGIPFVVRGVASDWPAINPTSKHRWTNKYLREKLGQNLVTVSLTGDGYADAVNWISNEATSSHHHHQPPTTHPNGTGHAGRGRFVFAAPHELQLPFTTVLTHLLQPPPPPSTLRTIAFLQLQNDCLRSPEYSTLLADVPSATPAWAAPILGTAPEAVNFWAGRAESVSSMHADPYENVYTVVRGRKLFTLYPPCDAFFMCKREVSVARWRACGRGGGGGVPDVELVLEEEAGMVPWIPITHPRCEAPLYPRFEHAPNPFVVGVGAGDSLYLPKGWLHHVEQEEDEEGLCIAVNAWYEGWDGMGLSWGWGEYAQKMDEMVGFEEH